MRSVVVYLAIGTLLLCPYDCAVKQAAAASLGSQQQSSCCEECRARDFAEAASSSQEQSQRDRAPNQPKPSEDGKSCLCEGVVFDATLRPPAEAILEFSLLAGVADAALEPLLAACPLHAATSGPPPLQDWGASMRIALGSLLL
jgi:hypothetical protein